MPRIRCHYDDCIHLESKFCTADSIELDPDMGCLTFTQEEGDDLLDEENWDDEDLFEDEEDWDDFDEDEVDDETEW